MIIYEIAKKNIIEFFRNFKSSIIVVLMPVIFLVIFGFVFNKSTNNIQFSIGVVADNSTIMQQFVSVLVDAKNTDNVTAVFNVNRYNSIEEAKQAVTANRDLVAVKWTEPKGITVSGDFRNPYYAAAKGIISSIANQFFQVKQQLVAEEPLDTETQSKFSGFDLIAPGMIIYGMLILIPHTASLMAQIREKKYILRYYLSKATSFDIVMGYLLSQAFLSLLQTIFLYYVCVAMGLKSVASIWDVALIAIPTNLFIVGVGLLIGSFTKTADNAANIGTMVSVVLGFMSGSFIVGIETILKIGEISGRVISLNQLFASSFATQAMSQIILYGKHIGDLSFEVIGLTVSSLIVLIAGVYFYNKLQLSKID